VVPSFGAVKHKRRPRDRKTGRVQGQCSKGTRESRRRRRRRRRKAYSKQSDE
jgi:hypothetical protein